MISIRHHSPRPSVKVHGNHLMVRSIRNVDILNSHINLRLHITQSLCYLPLGIVSNLLAQNLQRCWSDTKKEPSTFGIQESAGCMHTILEFTADPFANVTFSGGDPMYQAEGFAELARAIHTYTNKDIWCYTGFVYESLIQDEQRELLENLDVLVDGPFIQKLQDPDLLFRGSSNQRLIDVQKTLYAGEIILWQPNIAVL